jgi:hypothetical protein
MVTERAIVCGGLTADRLPVEDDDPVRLSRFGDTPNVRLQIERVRRELARELPGVLLDLLDLAAYVYAGDQAVRRGGRRADDLGASWRRRLFFRLPVREPDVWRDPETDALLKDVLGFLTEDEYLFDFRPWRGDRPTYQQYLDFGVTPFTGRVEEVVLFSGGLDSLAGAVREALGDRRPVLLLNHRSTGKLASGVEQLAAELGRRAGPAAPAFVPVWANKAEALGREYTQRSRSFLFASLGTTVASLIGLDRLRFYENGVVSLNLPLSAQVVGARASRTTHPRVLAGFGRLFSHLLNRPFAVENSFLWETKTEVVKRIGDADFGPLVGRATSCAHTWARSAGKTHCGDCSQCVDRRFAVLAAGLADYDPADGYEVDLLTGERADDESRLLLAGYLETARAVSRMGGPGPFLEQFAGEVARAVSFLPGRADEAAGRVYELYRRHAGQVLSVVTDGIGRHAGRLADRSLPDTCLLRQVLDPAPDVPAESTTALAAELPGDAPYLFRRHGQAWVVRFDGGEKRLFLPSRGAAYLHDLIAAPDRPTTAAELICRVHRHPKRYMLSPGGERADREALAAYRARYEDLAAELREAEANGDPARVERLQHERAALADEVARVTGLGGTPRRDTNDRERARKAVATAVGRAKKEIGRFLPEFARHLDRHLVCGHTPRYDPPPGISWQT